jgi:hypothetical protein
MQADSKNNKLFLTVAGLDCAASLGTEVETEAAGLSAPQLQERLNGELILTALADLNSEEAFLSHQLEYFGTRTQIDLNHCPMPNSDGAFSQRMIGRMRGFAWRLLRFAFDWTAFHQNVINEQQMLTLSHEVRLRRRENAELLRRIKALEALMEDSNNA